MRNPHMICDDFCNRVVIARGIVGDVSEALIDIADMIARKTDDQATVRAARKWQRCREMAGYFPNDKAPAFDDLVIDGGIIAARAFKRFDPRPESIIGVVGQIEVETAIQAANMFVARVKKRVFPPLCVTAS